MNKKLAIILSVILSAFLTIPGASEVQAMTDRGLSAKEDKIVTIAAFTANGNQQKLKTALNEGLDAGLTINEIKEVLVQMYAYAGFPRSLNGINTFMAVLEERERKGIKDVPGKEPGPMPAGKSSVELGTEIQTRLIGAPATGKYITFAPAIDAFLKGHLFGDIFGRDNLDFQSREIATISALACIDGVNPQLQSHFNVGLNVGLTELQLRNVINILEITVGRKEAANANKVLSDVLGLRQTEHRISVTRSGSLASSQGAADYFTGSVKIQMLFNAHDPSRTTGGAVTFQPGARTAWHSHPYGQTLIVTAGAGRIQQWGDPIVEFKQGDVAWIPPGVKHWHGAAPNSAMTHVAIQESLDGKTADWKEQVSEEQYLMDPASK
ncbi:carboxymuconolactone decarboxylase family protein [Geomonas subterranea]|uniref:Carboxymuconolactone decarboxylase family protein n=1 Tax=Geomonas subterranea TaxID=2847989 RepID=A0ABX8LPU8_9BACT|nr:carboxymuconolactone decarboxylase family protein [Geomonas subterranea]QXE92273.1 carboxymuconolactone decarboxylase family protein [Geomonas subterranea]QXM09627.1 carboxymuconolactone decarboxylase family protein [Geomonas subterranea]